MIRFCVLFSIFPFFSAVAQPISTTYLAGRTTGSIPYLKYGLGEDRLGGAKMGYLDTNVVVKVTDSIHGDYKLQLSKNHFAWLPKENFKQDSFLQIAPYYLTHDWKVYGDEKYDYVSISLDEELPYQSIQELDPSRIVVNIFGATSNTNRITHYTSAREIRNAYYEQVEDDVFRVIIDLNHQQHWGYRIYYEQKQLVIRIKRPPERLELEYLKVAVDAGHGGENVGAEGGTSHIAEKKFTLLFARELETKLLEEKGSVFMTRQKDTSLSMVERLTMLREQEPDLLISIHFNSSDKDTVQGAGTYYRYIGFRPLSLAILKRMMELGLKESGNVGSFNFSLNGATEYPNCLVEVAFLSNKEDEKRILDPAFHKAVAEKIVEGIKDWLATCK